MSTSGRSDAEYVMGRSAAETKRLQQQSELYTPPMRRLLEAAGITSGMKVLDIGTGAGDVALIVADMVGPNGTVVGIDSNPDILDTARTRTSSADWDNVSFMSGDLRNMELDHDFDAIVGRFVLMYLSDPGSAIKRLVQHLRPNGRVAFLEFDLTTQVRAMPDLSLYNQLVKWIYDTMRQARIEMHMGFKLHQAFRAAGLPAPQMRMEALMGSGPDWAGYDYLEQTFRSMLPATLKFGIATAEEVSIDTLADRLRKEVSQVDGVIMLSHVVGAWTHVP